VCPIEWWVSPIIFQRAKLLATLFFWIQNTPHISTNIGPRSPATSGDDTILKEDIDTKKKN